MSLSRIVLALSFVAGLVIGATGCDQSDALPPFEGGDHMPAVVRPAYGFTDAGALVPCNTDDTAPDTDAGVHCGAQAEGADAGVIVRPAIGQAVAK